MKFIDCHFQKRQSTRSTLWKCTCTRATRRTTTTTLCPDTCSMRLESFDSKLVSSNYRNPMLQNLYERLRAYIVEQGIDAQFIDEFQRLAAQHEHQLYVGLLKDMKQFVQ